MKDATLSELLRQADIKTENKLMVFSYSSWQYCSDIGRSTGIYIIFYQVFPIEHGKHVPGPVDQWNAESYYNAACTAGMALAHLRMLLHEFFKKEPDIIPE